MLDKSLPKISIITTVYNCVEYIEDAIVSVVNQTYPNIEYIVIDAGSTDGTVDIIKKYTDKIAYWTSEPDKGLYYGMDKGIRISNGDYFCVISADDFLECNDIIEIVAREISKDHLDYYYGDVYTIERCSRKISGKSNANIDKLKLGAIPHMGMFVKKSVYINLNGYNFTYKKAADYDFTIRMVKHGYYGRKIDGVIARRRKEGYSFTAGNYGYEDMLIRVSNNINSKYQAYMRYLITKYTAYLKIFIKNIIRYKKP